MPSGEIKPGDASSISPLPLGEVTVPPPRGVPIGASTQPPNELKGHTTPQGEIYKALGNLTALTVFQTGVIALAGAENTALRERAEGAEAQAAKEREALLNEKRLRAAAVYEGTHDFLTGIYNRAGFFSRGEELIANAKPDEVVVCYLGDLDRFKAVNDSRGHAAGDEALTSVAQNLQKAAGKNAENAIVARLSGDEYVVLIKFRWGEAKTFDGHANPILSKFTAELLEAVEKASQTYQATYQAPEGFGISLGMAHSVQVPNSSEFYRPELDELVKKADTAMYAVKQSTEPHSNVRHAPRR